jgi:hypothetical protein
VGTEGLNFIPSVPFSLVGYAGLSGEELGEVFGRAKRNHGGLHKKARDVAGVMFRLGVV